MLRALTRAVSPVIERCQLTHLERTPIDAGRAAAEHLAYEDTLRRLGATVERLTPAPDLPDGVFVEDTAIVLDELAVITRPGAPSRRPETASTAVALSSYLPLLTIQPPATLDGGDVLRIGRDLYVGRSSRTNHEGVEQLERLLAPAGYSVTAVVFQGCLHLKSAVSLVREDLLLYHQAWVDHSVFREVESLTVDPGELYAANALPIGAGVVYPAHYPRTADRLSRAGVRVEPVELTELSRAEAGVTCCSLLLHQ